nr:pseudouridylate synthase [Cryptomonas sp.]
MLIISKSSVKMGSYSKQLGKFSWPLLLKNYSKMNSIYDYSKIFSGGLFPFSRSIKTYIKNGIVNVDKPINLNPHQLVMWIKKFLNVSKIGQIFTLDTNVSGCLIIFIENSIHLLKSHLQKGKTFVGILKFSHLNLALKKKFCKEIKNFRGLFFQSLFHISNVKRQLKIRCIYSSLIIEFDEKRKTCILEIQCEFNAYISYLSTYLSVNFKNKCKLLELRQIKSGYLSENDNIVTLHDLLDSGWLYICKKNEFYIRKTIMPLEVLLTSYKRIVVKNSAVNSICYGAKLTFSGVVRIEQNLGKEDEIILMTIKGEAIATAISKINIITLYQQTQGVICIIKDIIMKRDVYPKKWGIGICSVKKHLTISSGFLFIKEKATKLKYWNF